MKLARERLEACLDGSQSWEYRLEAPLDEPLMRLLARGANLRYYPDFPRPYFRIEHPDLFVLQGVLGNAEFRATFPKDREEPGHAWLQATLFSPGAG